jgi:hypothetical protein
MARNQQEAECHTAEPNRIYSSVQKRQKNSSVEQFRYLERTIVGEEKNLLDINCVEQKQFVSDLKNSFFDVGKIRVSDL